MIDRGVRRVWARRARWAAEPALAALALTMWAAPMVAQDGVQTRVDLRCLTSRAEHCLPEPMSRDEPHRAICATCHDLVAQKTTADARATCTAAGCHEGPEYLTPYHRGLAPGILSDCVHCHDPHDAPIREGGASCRSCHVPGARLAEPRSFERRPLPGRPSGLDLTFRHAQHEKVDCLSCHSMERAHGPTTVTGLRDCRSCHHTQPTAGNCASCHEARDIRSVRSWVPRTLDIRTGSLDRPRRLLPFEHESHARIQCQACHTRGLSLSAAETDCSACHAAHHEPNTSCKDCHQPPAPSVHTRDAHLGCAGAGCHQAVPASVRDVPRTRSLCLVCHQTKSDHKPEGTCGDCHVLPRPRVGR